MSTRDDIEAALWRWSEWRADQRRVDAVLRLVDEYGAPADGRAEAEATRLLARAQADADRIRQAARAEAIRLVRTVRGVVEDATKVPA